MIASEALLARRKLVNLVMMALCTGAAALAILVLALILWHLVSRGVAALSPDILLRTTPPPGSPGGLLNPILGSLAMSAAGIAVAAPLGLLSGTYLAEYGRYSRVAPAVRFVNDILLSAPSIVVGLFVYSVMVMPMHHFSGWAGAAALALVAVPVIVRTTEDVLRMVPATLREAAFALGVPYWRFIVNVAWRAAKSGIVTGILLAVARISGETAPLLFTAFGNEFFSLDIGGAISAVPLTMYKFAGSGFENWEQLAWAGALLVTLFVLTTSLLARFILLRKRAAHD